KIERARVKMEQIKPRSTLPRGKKEGGLTVKLFKGHYTSGTFGRFFYDPVDNVHLFIERASNRVQVLAYRYK
ncbi:MAG: hypothetical protein ACREYE_01490, partial [Gammaproteobacteria bacterium]